MMQEVLRQFPFPIWSCIGLLIFVSLFLMQFFRVIYMPNSEVLRLSRLALDDQGYEEEGTQLNKMEQAPGRES